MNAQGFVFELPGGSSLQPGVDCIDVAMDELEQETGIRLARERFRRVGQRQVAATMIANEALLRVENLRIEVPTRHNVLTAVDDVSFTIAPGEDYYANSPLRDPAGPSQGSQGPLRVFRGGSWNYDGRRCC